MLLMTLIGFPLVKKYFTESLIKFADIPLGGVIAIADPPPAIKLMMISFFWMPFKKCFKCIPVVKEFFLGTG